MNTEHDPKLQAAMAEIVAICNKYDVGAFIALASKTHAELQLQLKPTWATTIAEPDPLSLAAPLAPREKLIFQLRAISLLGVQKLTEMAVSVRISRPRPKPKDVKGGYLGAVKNE